MRTHKNRIIYSSEYYRMEEIKRTSAFKSGVDRFYAEYEKFGIPVPRRGFDSYENYEKWLY
ncbi:MAG: hypothetical protein V1716_03240, partial [Candidatus Uhrbacteria bacterium]